MDERKRRSYHCHHSARSELWAAWLSKLLKARKSGEDVKDKLVSKKGKEKRPAHKKPAVERA